VEKHRAGRDNIMEMELTAGREIIMKMERGQGSQFTTGNKRRGNKSIKKLFWRTADPLTGIRRKWRRGDFRIIIKNSWLRARSFKGMYLP
jgi:hypothetical protein